MARRTEIMLDRGVILTAAFALLEEHGLDRLTMRAVADRLSVHPPALYWHFRGKAELMGWMAAEVLGDARLGAEGHEGWRGWLEAFARRLFNILLARRDVARLCATAQLPVTGTSAEQGRQIAEPLTRRGLNEKDAHAAIAAVMAFTLGWATYLSNAPVADLLGKLMDIDETFDRGLMALLDGLVIEAGSG